MLPTHQYLSHLASGLLVFLARAKDQEIDHKKNKCLQLNFCKKPGYRGGGFRGSWCHRIWMQTPPSTPGTKARVRAEGGRCCNSDAPAIAECVDAGKSPKLIARLRINSRLQREVSASRCGYPQAAHRGCYLGSALDGEGKGKLRREQKQTTEKPAPCPQSQA